MKPRRELARALDRGMAVASVNRRRRNASGERRNCSKMAQMDKRRRSTWPLRLVRPEGPRADAARDAGSTLSPALRTRRGRTASPSQSPRSARAPALWGGPSTRRTNAIAGAIAVGFGYFAVAVDALAIVAASSTANALFRLASFGHLPAYGSVVDLGAIVALLAVVWGLQTNAYGLANFASFSSHFRRSFATWNFAFFCAAAIGFATKTSEEYSRGLVAMFYVAGFGAMLAAHWLLVQLVLTTQRAGYAPHRRVVFVGFEDNLNDVLRRYEEDGFSRDVVAAVALRDSQAYLADDLALCSASIRMLRPSEICIAVPWSRASVIEACVDEFLRTPSEIHLAPDALLDRFTEAKVEQIGPVLGLSLTRSPLSLLQQAEKRLFDILVSSLALLALAPLLLFVALAVRFESAGPALFRQTRYGFNQEPFRIFKFRSMRTMEDGAKVRSATRGDPRVTRLGAFLRRASIDELPQLINVLVGEMSIVGPRPHAMAHDQTYVARLSRYARRHNVKPGITGWAQVHGLRGEISNDGKMHARLEHDLYYVDNWSLWLDIKIIAMTVFSRSAHANAY